MAEPVASLERLLGEPALAVVRHAPAALGSLTLAQAAAQLAQQKATSF